MWWTVIGFAALVALSSFTARPDPLWVAPWTAAGAAFGFLVWRFLIRPPLPTWLKGALIAVGIGFTYYFFHTDPGTTMISLLLYCLPVGAVFGLIVAALSGQVNRSHRKLAEQQRHE